MLVRLLHIVPIRFFVECWVQWNIYHAIVLGNARLTIRELIKQS